MLLNANYYIDNNNIKKAADILQDILNFKIEYSDLYFLLGKLFKKRSHLNKAEFCFLKTLKFEYFNSQSLFYLSLINFIKKNYLDCIKYLKEFIIKINNYKVDCNVYYLLSCSYYQLNMLNDAIKYIKLAISIKFKNSFILLLNNIQTKQLLKKKTHTIPENINIINFTNKSLNSTNINSRKSSLKI